VRRGSGAARNASVISSSSGPQQEHLAEVEEGDELLDQGLRDARRAARLGRDALGQGNHLDRSTGRGQVPEDRPFSGDLRCDRVHFARHIVTLRTS
jgi:hypothetical protein